jgi:hypothetical protein
MEHRWNETDRGKRKYSGKTCPSATLSTTNPTWTDSGSNPVLCGERPVTNRLSHSTAHFTPYCHRVFLFKSITKCFWLCSSRVGIFLRQTYFRCKKLTCMLHQKSVHVNWRYMFGSINILVFITTCSESESKICKAFTELF